MKNSPAWLKDFLASVLLIALFVLLAFRVDGVVSTSIAFILGYLFKNHI